MGTKGVSKIEAELVSKLSQSGVTKLGGLVFGRGKVGSSRLSIWELGVSIPGWDF